MKRPRRWSRREVQAHLTTALTLIVGLLSLLGVADPEIVYAATLSVLAYLAYELVNGAHLTAQSERTVEELRRALREARPYSFDQLIPAAVPGVLTGLERARDIWLVGVTLNRTVRSNLTALERCLRSGGSVHLVLIDPMSTATREAALRNGLGDEPALFEHRLSPTIDLVNYLRALPHACGRLDVRVTAFVPSFGLIGVDPDASHGRLTLEVYSHRPAGQELSLTLSPDREPRWYGNVREELEHIWRNARPLEAVDSRG